MIEIIETTIGDIAKKIRTGKTPPTKNKLNFDNGNYNWFTPGDFTVPKVLESSKRKITDYAVENNAIVYEKNTVLVTCIGEIGNAGIIKEKASANQQITGINVKEGIILPEFFLYWFKANKDRVKNKANKAVVPILNNRALREIKVSFPKDLQTQNKIVTLLDKANTLILQRKKSITLLEELLRGQFLELFGEGLNNISNESKQLSDISTIVSGITKGRRTKEREFFNVPYLRVANAQDGYFDLKEIKHIDATRKEVSKYKVEKFDLLLTEGGDPDKLGRGAVWTEDVENMIYQNHLYRIRINDLKQYSIFWLSCLISSDFGKRYFLQQAKQTTGIATINKKQVSAFPIPDSPYSEQSRFEEFYHFIQNKKQILKTSLNHLEDLFQSLLQKAFKGELTFNLKAELNSLLAGISPIEESNDWSGFRNNTTTTEELLRRLNQQEFEDQEQYQQAKWVVQQLLEEGQVEQVQEEGSTSLRIRKA